MALTTLLLTFAVTRGDAWAAFPGENGKVAFFAAADGVVTVNPDGSARRRVAAGSDPAFSPTGAVIAFQFQNQVWSISADGSGTARQLTTAGGFEPAFSPDGKEIAFMAARPGDEGFEIYIMDSNGEHERSLTNSPSDSTHPTFSPDGRQIAFSRGGRIHVMDADGSNVRALPGSGSGRDDQPDYSPDGSRIAFTAQRGDCADIWVMDANGTGASPLTTRGCRGGYFVSDPAFSPDGEKIAFVNGLANEIWVMDSNGDDEEGFTDGPSDRAPSWGAAVSSCRGEAATMIGTQRDEKLRGTEGRDVILALGGDDTVKGGERRDVICGGSGDDAVFAGRGDDRVASGSGDDRIRGGRHSDRLRAGSGDDRIRGGRHSDRLRAGSGDDRLRGGRHSDRLRAGSGDDRLRGGRHSDSCHGGGDSDGATGCEQKRAIP